MNYENFKILKREIKTRKTEFITQTKYKRVISSSIIENEPFVILKTTVKELEAFLKKVKSKKKQLKGTFFIHLNAEMSFLIEK